MRQPIIAANWKMYKTVGEALAFADGLRLELESQPSGLADVEIVVAPPFTALAALAARFEGSRVQLAAQNVYPEEAGAFTGEISPAMLAEIGCAYTIVGHSERRTLFGESDAFVSQKAAALLGHGIRPIVCIGESASQREAKRTFEVVERQLEGSLAKVPQEKLTEIVLAYEPIWAIGTGKTATPEMAQEVHAFIREQLRKHAGDTADAVRIQYGGSVKPENINALMAQADIDGALVGGASLNPKNFATILRFENP